MPRVDADGWRALTPYLVQAVEIVDTQAREAWLASIRETDPALATSLDVWLQDLRVLRDERFLEAPAVPRPTLDTLAGARLGAYRLVSPIGHGGMSTVWLAKRCDGHGDRHRDGHGDGRAAIKILNLALTGRGEDRFRREGRLLARLAHPHITRLLDTGVVSTGQPYLVLEYVDGLPIDEYCDRHRLDVAARLRVFLDVVGAVSHAHAARIVHRDIKPSNVLVTTDGRVALLDFGIAKLRRDDDDGERDEQTAQTVITVDGAAALTPAYAAPEQLTGDPVSTVTDVYALGVLLYVLLTGRHPAGARVRSAAGLVKAIVETTPTRPSDVVIARPEPGAASADTFAAARATTPDALRRLLRGNLDTIVTTALNKDPADRFPSADALGDDVRRHLRHEPIRARPTSIRARVARFVRRIPSRG